MCTPWRDNVYAATPLTPNEFDLLLYILIDLQNVLTCNGNK